MRPLRILLVALFMLGCRTVASLPPTSTEPAASLPPTSTEPTEATAEVPPASPGPCDADEDLCSLAPFEDRSRFFEQLASERARLELLCEVDASACRALAESYGYLQRLRMPSDARRAVELYTALCQSDEVDGCEIGGLILLERPDLVDAPARAAVLLDRACALGREAICYLAGVERLPNGRLPTDPARAVIQLRSACQQGEQPACLSLVRASENGVIELPPETLDAVAGAGARVIPSASPRCERLADVGFYGSVLSELSALAPSHTLTAPGGLEANRLSAALQRLVTCTLEGAYGDEVRGSSPTLRYLRVLAPIAGGLDVFLEWGEREHGALVMLHATRLHLTQEYLRVLSDVEFEVSSGFALQSSYDTSLDVDSDGLRDVLLEFEDAELDEGEIVGTRRTLILAASRPGLVSAMVLPFDDEAEVNGCFLPSLTTPTLLLMESQRDPEVSWSSSCLNLHAFPAFDLESVEPITFALGPRLVGGGVVPSLPPGGALVGSERRAGRAARARGRFPMCPAHPVFLLRGHDGDQPIAQVVSNVSPSPGGSLGPALTSSSGMLPCDQNKED